MERDYSRRSVVDKLGIKPGCRVALVDAAGPIDAGLRSEVLDRAGRGPASAEERPDIVLITVDASSDAVAILGEWWPRINPSGGIWLLSPKRGLPGYLNQTTLIEAGLTAGLVDNKVCSVSDRVSAMRFVIRREDR